MDLSDGERISMIRSAVLIQYTRVTDRQTDRHTERRTDGIGVAYTRYSIYAVARKIQQPAKNPPQLKSNFVYCATNNEVFCGF